MPPIKKKENAKIVIRWKKRRETGDHHSSAWKIAYADFVTAMMAFFLVMWLINIVTDRSKSTVSNKFDPIAISDAAGGSSGVMGKESVIETFSIEEEESKAEDSEESEFQSQAPRETLPIEKLDSDFEESVSKAQQTLEKVVESQRGKMQVIYETKKDGWRINIIDSQKEPLFDRGSYAIKEEAKKLLSEICTIIKRNDFSIIISGHTDSVKFPTKDYSNWELSSDRANSVRRFFVENGMDMKQILEVRGKADTDPLLPEDPSADANRRVSIFVPSNHLK